MNMKQRSILAFTLAVAGCTQVKHGDGVQFTSGAVLQCPDDYVAYDFGKAPIELNSEYYQAALGADAAVPYYLPSGIQVTGVQCWDHVRGQLITNTYRYQYSFQPNTDAKYLASHKSLVADACNGQPQCQVFNTDYCDYSYTCDSDPNKVLHTGGLIYGNLWGGKTIWNGDPFAALSCMSPSEVALRARRAARQTTTACVPKNCRGKAHRDADLNCVADPNMSVFSLASIKVTGPSALTTRYNPELTQQSVRLQTLYSNASYDSWASVDYGAVAPKDARLIYWMSDVYVPKSVNIPADASPATLDQIASQSEVKEAFRCAATTLDLGRPANDDKATKVARQHSAQLSPECFESQRVVDNLAALTGQKNPLDSYKYLGTRLNRSLDIIGRNLFVPGAANADPNKVCAPNPPEFYFDATTSTYDMTSYYKQRQVDSLFAANDTATQISGTQSGIASLFTGTPQSRAVADFGGKGTWVSVGNKAPVLRIGPKEVRTTVAEIDVTTSRGGLTELPVDVSWFLAHADKNHLLNPQTMVLDNRDGFVPTMVPVASFYLWPTDGATSHVDMPKIGELNLNPAGANPEGKTDSTTLTFSQTIRNMFFDSKSPLYVAASQQMRSYELVVCIDARVNEQVVDYTDHPSTDSRFFADNPKLSLGLRSYARLYHVDENGRQTDMFQVGSAAGNSILTNPVYQLAIGTGYDDAPYTPWQGFGPGQGCRVASTPIVVHALRLSYPVNPTQHDLDPGESSDVNSGSNDMAASQGSDSETTCENKDPSHCREATNSNMESSGEMGRSFYNSDGSLTRSEGKSADLDSSSEMLGMQLVDMADPMGETESVGWPKDANATHQAQTPVTLTVEPPWEDIRNALRKAKGKEPIEWTTGHYAGIMGLGVGWGFKVQLQIGPIPGLVTITISGGLGVAATAELQFAPTEDDAYFCTGDADCVGIETTPLSFADAAQSCAEKGGRLAELGTTAEANSVIDSAKSGKAKYWLGGQQAYEYPNPSCAAAFNRAACLPTAVSSYRWLSNDAEFAAAKGDAAAKYVVNRFSGTGQTAFSTTLPNMSALLYDGKADAASLAATDEKHQYICRYTAVNNYKFLRWSLGLELGIAAGIGMSFCVPSDDPGICLGGDMNIVGLALKPTYEHKYYFLRDRNQRLFAMAGFTEASVPYDITLLEGAFWAKVSAWIFTVQWNILEFEGFKVKAGKLAETHDQFRVNF